MNWQPMEVQPFDPASHAAEAAERRKRLMGNPKPVKRLPIVRKPVTVAETPRCFDAHVCDWRRHCLLERVTAFEYIKFRCEELGVSYTDVIGPSRFGDHVRPRQMLIWELKNTRPWMTLHQIGKEFGGRDHSTLVHSIRQHEKRMAAHE